MSDARNILKEFLLNLFYFLVFYSIAALFTHLVIKEIRYVYLLVLMAVPFFSMIFIRLKVRQFSLFFLTHLLLIVLVFFISGISGAPRLILDSYEMDIYQFICVVFILACALYSCVRRIKNKDEILETSYLIVGGLLLFALCLTSELSGYPELRVIFLVVFALMMAGNLLYTHINSIDYSLEIITSTTSQPVGKILSFNNRLITAFLAVLMLVAAAAFFLRLDSFIPYMMSGLLFLIRSLISRMFTEGEELPVESITPVANEMNGASLVELFGEPKEAGIFWIVLQQIMIYVVIILLIVGAVAAIAYAIHRVYRGFYENSAKDGEDETKEYVIPDILERIKAVFNLDGFAPANKIRRQFYKKVRRHMQEGIKIQASDTASEIAEKIKPSENIDALTRAYEDTRYSSPSS